MKTSNLTIELMNDEKVNILEGKQCKGDSSRDFNSWMLCVIRGI